MENIRIFVEKKPGFQTEAISLADEIRENLRINLENLRLINIYDCFNIEEDLVERAKYSIFGERQTDNVFTSFATEKSTLAVEFLEGQFDQRADSAMQCLSLIDSQNKATIRSGKLYVWDNKLTKEETAKIKKYLINTVEAKEKNLSILELAKSPLQQDVKKMKGFINYTEEELFKKREELGLAMTNEDIALVQIYFRDEEKRDPYETEIRVLDTYWSDHCRHQTFETILENPSFEKDCFTDFIRETFLTYLDMRKELGRCHKPITLMDMATVNARYEKKNGYLDDLEQSEENNACSIVRECEVNGKKDKYLIMFKNETHNHPTEIEPFGGASTCIGGAIRDPLSGRSYVYQAMRISGAADITEDVASTIVGKLPQRVISKGAAHGYSSYGNQIGLATTYVKEVFHPGYKAKRMEVGAVVGAVLQDTVRRESPEPGDLILLLGGKTGRDGIGGATGSSKAHNEKSVSTLSAEVQKGNAPEERKLQRLFKRPEVCKLIKKSNDFGAGGVSVAVGELADGLEINLDNVPVKYTGLNATELAISESQERMAVVIEKKDYDEFIKFAYEENLLVTKVAEVTGDNRLKMKAKGEYVVDISRDFLKTNGARSFMDFEVAGYDGDDLLQRNPSGANLKEKLVNNMLDLNVQSQQGLVEMFDATIGSSTVLMPYGGKKQLTPSTASVERVLGTNTASIMAYGFDPELSNNSPFHGSIYAHLEAISKVVAVGGDYKTIRFTLQEYFPRLGNDPRLWGSTVQSLLGSIYIQKEFHLASIGGKDSMSGTFNELEVPKTLIAFAVTTESSDNIISQEFKTVGNHIYLVNVPLNDYHLPNIEEAKKNFEFIHTNILNKTIVSAYPIEFGGLSEALIKASLGNGVGINVKTDEDLFKLNYGSMIIETDKEIFFANAVKLGTITEGAIVINDVAILHDEINKVLNQRISSIYPTQKENQEFVFPNQKVVEKKFDSLGKKEARVFIPAFPGTNCDYDTARAFEDAGAITKNFVFRNTRESDVEESIKTMASEIDNCDIFVLSGGFSLGDEPDGSGKFIANVLQEVDVKEAIERLIARKGLVLGICNGFQALVKSGLLPFGKLGQVNETSATLFRNNINRHVSRMVDTRTANVNSPWLSGFNVGDIHTVAVSHGEGKFMLTEEDAKRLFENGQIAFQYVDNEGNPTMDPKCNINGSYYAIEGITSPDGLVLGKMGHSERMGKNNYKNIYGNTFQDIFTNAVKYIKKEK